MGAVKKPLKKIERAVKKQTRKVSYAVQGGKEKARGDTPTAQTAAPSTAAARDMGEEMEAVVETEGAVMKKRRKGKKALVTQTAAANVGGEGGSGLNIPVTQEISMGALTWNTGEAKKLMGRDADDEEEMIAEPTDMMPDTTSSAPTIEQSERMKKYKSKIIV